MGIKTNKQQFLLWNDPAWLKSSGPVVIGLHACVVPHLAGIERPYPWNELCASGVEVYKQP